MAPEIPMVANDDITLDSFLDVESMTVEGAADASTTTIADTIAKAIMWNHGFGATDMVLRTAAKLSNRANDSSPQALGMADAVKVLDTNRVGTTTGEVTSYIKHGNIIALHHRPSRSGSRFIRMYDGKVDGGGGQKNVHSLPREWGSERFLVIQKGDKYAFYSICHNAYIREFRKTLDGSGGEVLLDPPRFCELFKVLNAGVGMIRLETPSGLIASYTYITGGSGRIESVPNLANATRAIRLQGLNHFIYTVLEVPPDDASTAGDPDHPVTRYLEATGILSAQQLAFDATEDNLTSTVLLDTAGVDITGNISLSTKQRILALKAWINAQFLPNNCHTELMALTYETYEDFRLADTLDKMNCVNAYAPVHAPVAPVAPTTDPVLYTNPTAPSLFQVVLISDAFSVAN